MGTMSACPQCGASVMAGAMRCASCGRLQITPEEQRERYLKLKASREARERRSGIVWVLLLLVLVAAIVAGFIWWDRIGPFLRSLAR